MNKIFFIKSIIASIIVTIAIVLSMFTGCQLNLIDDSCCANFTAFEKEFANSLSSQKDVVKLIGFQTFTIDDENERIAFRNNSSEIEKELLKRGLKSIVFSDDFSFYRVYFPLHTAIVEYNGKSYTANEKGVVYISNMTDISKVKVIGRQRSEKVHGTGSNIIEKDRILLKNEFKQEVRNGVKVGYPIEGNACVFDFKALTNMDASCCSNDIYSNIPRLKSGNESEDDKKVSCNENYGGMNCSNAFGIYGGICPLINYHCMDYNGYNPLNGWYSDYVKGPKTYYLGSDCNIAMAAGHCWNEVN